MKLFTKSIFDRLVKNHKEQDGTKSFKVVVKLFNPIGNETWYLSELNPETNIAFGLCCMSHKEYGYVDINELINLRLKYPLVLEGAGNNRLICPSLIYKIERDKYFESNKKTLEECRSLWHFI